MTQNEQNTSHGGGFSPILSDSDPLIPFDVRDQNGRRGMYILIGSILALLAIATVIFVTYQPGTRDRGEPPRIKADNQPFKVEPADPGGVQTPDQDKSVYDVMAGKNVDESVVTVPGAEEPLQMPKSANIQVDSPRAVSPRVEVTTPAPKPVAKPKPSVTVTAPRTATPVATGDGDYLVQVASLRSAEAAADSWVTLSRKFNNELVSGLYSDIAQADLGDKGIFYRLRVAGLADKNAAEQLCAQFKARGQACLVKKR